MMLGAHVLLYTNDADADRVFIRDVLGFPHVDAGHGWLIFRLPPSELAVHPMTEGGPGHHDAAMVGAHLYLMCDNLEAEMKALSTKKVVWSAVEREPWGLRTTFRLPSGGELGLYQPMHPTALRA